MERPVEQVAPVTTAPPPAKIADATPQGEPPSPALARLAGDWIGQASYSTLLRGSDCSVSVSRNWKISISGNGAGNFTTALVATGGTGCEKLRYASEVIGAFTVRATSATALQVNAKTTRCAGDCDENGGLFLYRTLNRSFRMGVSAKADRLSFSDNATDFVLRRK